MLHLRIYFYRIFGRIIADIRFRKRARFHRENTRSPSSLETAFRELENRVGKVKYPDNNFNKIMSMILSDIELFEHIVNRFRRDRQFLAARSHEDAFLHRIDPNRRSYPAHPYERENNQAIKIDVQSLFIFGTILVNRSLLLLKMYLPDNNPNPDKDIYSKIGRLYYGLIGLNQLSTLGQKFKTTFSDKIKWHYSALRFYRNEFIEHLDKGYQQGMNFGVYTQDFALSSYKWNYDDTDNQKVEDFRTKLESRGVQISGRNDGGRSLINRYYVQRLFDNITQVPHDLLEEALEIIEDVGVHSPQPEKIITEIEGFIVGIFDFMREHIDESELAQYQTQ